MVSFVSAGRALLPGCDATGREADTRAVFTSWKRPAEKPRGRRYSSLTSGTQPLKGNLRLFCPFLQQPSIAVMMGLSWSVTVQSDDKCSCCDCNWNSCWISVIWLWHNLLLFFVFSEWQAAGSDRKSKPADEQEVQPVQRAVPEEQCEWSFSSVTTFLQLSLRIPFSLSLPPLKEKGRTPSFHLNWCQHFAQHEVLLYERNTWWTKPHSEWP